MLRFFVAICFAASMIVTTLAAARDIAGDWSGKLQAGSIALKLVFHIPVDDSAVTMDSPDQGAFGIEGETVALTNDSISFRIPKLMMTYNGALKDGKLEGTFQQGGLKIPLVLERGVEKPKRPQTPQPPFPYKKEDVTISNTAASSSLSGTLTIPENADASTPVVVFVSGSGLQNRDEELFEHRPFAVIADYLARNGIASLRYDDRGCGKSTGDVANATTADFASDAKAAIEWLRGQKRFGKTGIIGHSEGGIIAYMLGAEKKGPDFIISLAGSAVKGAEIIAYQNKYSMMKAGIPEKSAEEKAKAAVKHLSMQSNPWMKYYLEYDPAAALGSLKIPAFIVYGEKDMQVPPALNIELAKRLAKKAEIREYADLNHLMQHAETGDMSEYSTIEETISPELLSDIVTFIRSLLS